MEEKGKNVTINISTRTIVKVIVVLLILALIYLLRDVILILVVSLILTAALNPWVNSLQRRKVPRILATVFIYLAFFGTFIIILILMIPPIAEQVKEVAANFPDYYRRITSDFEQFRDFSLQESLFDNLESWLSSLSTNIGQTTAGVFSALVTLFGGLFAFAGVFVITFYMLLEENALKKFVKSVTSPKYQPYIFQLLNRMQERLRLWLRGQLILSLIIGVLTYVGLLIIGVKYSLILGLWAGLTEFIPYLGPMLGAIPAVFIALTTGSFVKALFVVIWYIIIQQLENDLIVPKVMEKTVGLNPLVVIIVMLIGAKLAGIVGLLLAIPVTLILKAFMEDFLASREKKINILET